MTSRSTSRLRAAAVLAVLVLGCTGCEWMTWATPSVTGGALDASAGTRALTSDARYLVFATKATNATPDAPTNGKANLYRRDLHTGTTARISFTTTGGDPNQGSNELSITADGRYVAFFTAATNMDSNHVGGAVFVRDMSSTSVTRIDTRGTGATFSADGRYLAVTDLVGTSPEVESELYRYDLATQAKVLVDPNFGSTSGVGMDATGNRVLFAGASTTPPTGVTFGSFIHDFTTGISTPVSGIPDGATIEAASSDLSKVLYQSGLDLYVRDLTTASTTLVTQTADGQPMSFFPGTDLEATLGASMSADGTHVAFWSSARNLAVGQTPQTTLDQIQVFVRDLTTGVTTEVDKSWNDQPVAPYVEESETPGLETALDGTGSYVAFDGLTPQFDPTVSSTNLNVFVRAVAAPQPTAMVPSSLAPGSSTSVTVTGHGFAPSSQLLVSTSANNSTGVTVSDVHVTSSTSFTATIVVSPSVPVGTLVVGVLNPPPGPGLVPYSAGTCDCATISP
jgi:hypothetical protein